jgi:hypothetical protein
VVASPLSTWPLPVRVAIGGFLLLILGFYGTAQLNLALQSGTRGVPGPQAVLERYHGSGKSSRLHAVLDPSLAEDDPQAMYPHLGHDEEERRMNLRRVLTWVEAGAPRSGWSDVAEVFASSHGHGCVECHSTAEGGTRARADLPLETYEQVVPFTVRDHGMSRSTLALSTHNHVMGFAVSSLLVSLLFAFSLWRRGVVVTMVVAAFAGPAIDVASWWLTHLFGHPFQYGVILGGSLYGVALVTMSLLVLDELWLGSRLRRMVQRAIPGLSDPAKGTAGTQP